LPVELSDLEAAEAPDVPEAAVRGAAQLVPGMEWPIDTGPGWHQPKCVGSDWQAFVKRAIDGEPDDPFVSMLRRRLSSGSKVVRVQLDTGPRVPEYRVLLERLRELSELRVPHSASFTRWSLDAGVRLANAGEEATRFALLAAEALQPIADEFSADYADAILIEQLRALGPPRTAALLVRAHAKPVA
jgi:hypothetical protein